MDFFSNCNQTRIKLRIWSHLLKKSLMQNFIFLWSMNLEFKNIKLNTTKYWILGRLYTYKMITFKI